MEVSVESNKLCTEEDIQNLQREVQRLRASTHYLEDLIQRIRNNAKEDTDTETKD